MKFLAVDIDRLRYEDPRSFFGDCYEYFFDIRSLGTAVFESLRTYEEGKFIFAVEEHVDRLFKSAEILLIEHVFSREQVIGDLRKLVEADRMDGKELRVNICLTNSFFWLKSVDLLEPKSDFYEKGVEVVDETFERPFAGAKYPSPVYSFFDKKRPAGVFETIFFNDDGYLREGNISNVFAVFGDKIVTPASGVLPGITSMHVQEAVLVEKRELTREELMRADEIFLTNTSKEVIPVRKWGEWENDDFTKTYGVRLKFQEFMREKMSGN